VTEFAFLLFVLVAWIFLAGQGSCGALNSLRINIDNLS
jgi:hypothetical protein